MKILDNFINQRFGSLLFIFMIFIVCMLIFMYVGLNSPRMTNYDLQHREIINSSMCVSFQPSTSIPLPENNCTYHIYISTTMRGQHDVYVGYSYISYETISDRFGSYKKPIYHGFREDYITSLMDGYVGITNDNIIINSTLVIPPGVDQPTVVMTTGFNDYISYARVIITKL